MSLSAATTRRLGICVATFLALSFAGWFAVFIFRSNISGPTSPRAYQDIENLKTQLQLFEHFTGHLPSACQGLMILVALPSNEPPPQNWHQLLSDPPLDPWGTPYQYRYPAVLSKKDPYDLFSCGKDKRPNTADDIGNW